MHITYKDPHGYAQVTKSNPTIPGKTSRARNNPKNRVLVSHGQTRLSLTPHTQATNCLASSTAQRAALFNSLLHSVSLQRDHALSPTGGWILSVSYPCLIIL